MCSWDRWAARRGIPCGSTTSSPSQNIEVRDRAVVQAMRARLVEDPDERTRLWSVAVEAYPDYADYQERTERVIPLFRAEPV